MWETKWIFREKDCSYSRKILFYFLIYVNPEKYKKQSILGKDIKC